MLLIPAENMPSKSNVPVLTLLLVILNVMAFFMLQGDDDIYFQDAFNEYTQQELLSIESSVYEQYILENRQEIYDHFVGQSLDENIYYQATMLQDKSFARYIEKLPSYSLEWRKKREAVNEHLNKMSSFKYAFYPNDMGWFTAFSYMFMHGDIGHLIGNMIFMLLFGFNLELLVGRLKMLGVYLLSGLGAVGLFAVTTSDPATPLVGASGAISGLMGGFAAFYGLKKINYFYWIFIFAGTIRLPAFLVLLYWLGKEYVSAGNNDGIAYMAHFGGLLAGAGLVYAMNAIARLSSANSADEYHDYSVADNSESSMSQISRTHAPQRQVTTFASSHATSGSEQQAHNTLNDSMVSSQGLLQKAINAINELEFERAKSYLYEILQHNPHHSEALMKLFSLEKNTPDTKAFQNLCNTIFQQACHDDSLQITADNALATLQVHRNSFASIPAQTLHDFARAKIRQKRPHDAKPLVNFMIKHYGEFEGLDNLLLHFALAFDSNDDFTLKHKVLTYVSNTFKESFAAQEARKVLHELN